jgi:hypothetical protein
MFQSVYFIGASRQPLDGDGGDADALDHHKAPARRDSTTIDRYDIDLTDIRRRHRLLSRVMGKSQDAKKNIKKAPTRTPKEKKELKRLKKAGK